MARKFKAVFFDVGGTLIQPYPSVGEIYARAARSYGADCDPKVLDAEFKSAWLKRGGLSSLGEETNEAKERGWWRSLVREVFASHGGVPSFDRFFHELHQSFVNRELWEIFPEVLDVLTELRAKGLVLGIVSNWDLRLPKVLKNLGLDSYFDFWVSSSVSGAAKPSAQIFKEALKRARVRPEEAVHVGDSYEEDYLGAKPLGITAYLVARNGTTTSVPSEFRISSLKELRGRIL